MLLDAAPPWACGASDSAGLVLFLAAAGVCVEAAFGFEAGVCFGAAFVLETEGCAASSQVQSGGVRSTQG